MKSNYKNFSFKISTSAYAEFINDHDLDQVGNIRKQTEIIRTSSDINSLLASTMYELFEEILEIDLVEYGYTYKRMQSIKFGITKSTNERGGPFIDIPECIEKRKAVINIQNDNENCFLYCITATNHPVAGKKHPYRAKQYEKYFKDYNITAIKFPLELKDIEKFERNNKKAINVICNKREEFEVDVEKQKTQIEFYTEYLLSKYYNSTIPREQEIYKHKMKDQR